MTFERSETVRDKSVVYAQLVDVVRNLLLDAEREETQIILHFDETEGSSNLAKQIQQLIDDWLNELSKGVQTRWADETVKITIIPIYNSDGQGEIDSNPARVVGYKDVTRGYSIGGSSDGQDSKGAYGLFFDIVVDSDGVVGGVVGYNDGHSNTPGDTQKILEF